MLIALAACHKDIDACLDWADWLHELQPDYANHTALVMGSSTLDRSQILELVQKFRTAGFKSVSSIQARTEETPSWPNAANAMWRAVALWIKDNARCSWLWCESDAIPMSAGWLDKIESEYLSQKRAFMGTLYPIPYNHLNGISVYPSNIHRFNPLYFNSEFYNLPFDCVRPDLTLHDAYITKSIVRSLADPGSNTAHTFETVDDLSIIPPDCLLFHGCKDGSLIARLREIKNPQVISKPEEKKIGLGGKIYQVAQAVTRLVSGPQKYIHAGNLGDILYSLPAIKAAGGGDLIICPQQRNTAVCAVPVDRKQFEMLEPLLKLQPYLNSVSYSEKYPSGCRDLNHFRNHWNNPAVRAKHDIGTLCACHFYELGILDKFDDREPWLVGVKPMETGKIVIHRSPRYNSPPTGKDSFPWQKLVNEHHEEMMFIGLESEWDAFCRNFGKKISFFKVRHFLEMASVIAGGKCFVGNQSFPLSIALGLGKDVICEALPRSPDCRMFRNNYQDQLIGEIVL